jgi:hypothetical protein
MKVKYFFECILAVFAVVFYLDEVRIDDLQLGTKSKFYRYRNPAGKLSTDQSGHIIGDRFGGSNGLDNIVAMDAHVNQSDFKTLENTLADAIKSGKTVKVEIDISYDLTGRPTMFDIKYWIDDMYRSNIIPNQV